jgi:DNA-binding NtrC family response regulator
MTKKIENPIVSVLIVNGDDSERDQLKDYFTSCNYEVVTAASEVDALQKVKFRGFDIVVCDSQSIHEDEIGLIMGLRRLGRGEDVIALGPTSESKRDHPFTELITACVERPVDLDMLVNTVADVVIKRRERTKFRSKIIMASTAHGAQLKEHAPKLNERKIARIGPTNFAQPQLIGNSPAVRELMSIVDRVAPTNSSVLITGATGTGKELVARTIHARSTRREAPFVDINCSAIPDTLIEAELFGHQRGTFTGAHETRRGLFEEASGGTLFLDEVDALNLAAQAKLLRVLQERRVRRVGGRENLPIDVRIISATNRDLYAAVSEGAFRADLLFRLRVVPLHVSELYERGDDIRLLVEHFLQRHSERYGPPERRFSQEAMRVLMAYRWPGNVRELENTLEYAVAISTEDEMPVEALPAEVRNGSPGTPWSIESDSMGNLPLAEVERRHILAVLKRCGGHQIRTAAVLGIDRRTLYRRLQQYGALDKSSAQVC